MKKNYSKKPTGAGCVIYFDNREKIINNMPDEILYLVLVDNNNLYDFPKGAIDEFEDELKCAIRETYEETNLKNNKNYILYKNKSKMFSEGLVMFLASYNLDFEDLHKNSNLRKNIKILPNKVSDKKSVIEHKDFFWGTYDNIKDKFPNYLKEVLNWSKVNIH